MRFQDVYFINTAKIKIYESQRGDTKTDTA